jgi:hypothetical protein
MWLPFAGRDNGRLFELYAGEMVNKGGTAMNMWKRSEIIYKRKDKINSPGTASVRRRSLGLGSDIIFCP